MDDIEYSVFVMFCLLPKTVMEVYCHFCSRSNISRNVRIPKLYGLACCKEIVYIVVSAILHTLILPVQGRASLNIFSLSLLPSVNNSYFRMAHFN